MGNLNSFNETHVTFRNKGDIDVELGFEAFAQIQFSTGSAQIFGTENFGSALNIPGLVTIGPSFKVLVVSLFSHIGKPFHTQNDHC
jgi:chitinase